MNCRSPAQRRPPEQTRPRSAIGPKNTEVEMDDGHSTLLEQVAQEILAVTYWFDPAPGPGPYPVTIRFSGRRVGVKKGRLSRRDRFVQDETIEHVFPGSGPIALTACIRDINPGEWHVRAQMLSPTPGPMAQGKVALAAASRPGVARIWHKWAPSVEADTPMNTCPLPFARVPGILPGVWGALATLGIIVALTLQSWLVSAQHLKVGAISLGAIVVGIVGAKLWYFVLYRNLQGWCIQGFLTGASLSAALLLVVLNVSVGAFLDATAPGLLFAIAIGRIGCFFAGCCGGPPTAAHFGVWSSDQRVGARRVPTQLMESGLALLLGLLVLAAFLYHGISGGAYFVGGLSAYTLGRQGILHLRAEKRKTKLGSMITSVLTALALLAAVVWLAR
jgi:phosphatidylglycerol---prolipoprotein diacylglyceryl transferase